MGPVDRDRLQETFDHLSRLASEPRPPTVHLTMPIAKYLVDTGNLRAIENAFVICDEETFRFINAAFDRQS